MVAHPLPNMASWASEPIRYWSSDGRHVVLLAVCRDCFLAGDEAGEAKSDSVVGKAGWPGCEGVLGVPHAQFLRVAIFQLHPYCRFDLSG